MMGLIFFRKLFKLYHWNQSLRASLGLMHNVHVQKQILKFLFALIFLYFSVLMQNGYSLSLSRNSSKFWITQFETMKTSLMNFFKLIARWRSLRGMMWLPFYLLFNCWFSGSSFFRTVSRKMLFCYFNCYSFLN